MTEEELQMPKRGADAVVAESVIERIQAVSVAAGDVLVLHTGRLLSTNELVRLADMLRSAVPEGVRVLVLEPGAYFEHLRPVASRPQAQADGSWYQDWHRRDAGRSEAASDGVLSHGPTAGMCGPCRGGDHEHPEHGCPGCTCPWGGLGG